MLRLKDKVAVITGAGSGIGEASAKLFAKEGAKVVVAEINTEAGQEVVKQIKAAGGEATFLRVDVSISADLKRLVQTALDTYGKLDILFNNAGIADEPLEKTTEEDWRRTIDVNLTGQYLACMYAIPVMQKQGGGNILFTGSVGGIMAVGRRPAYTASKGALVILTKLLARYLGKDNIRVNCVCPGPVDTGLTEFFMGFPKTEEERRQRQAARIAPVPLGRAAKAEEIASVALFLASDEASYVTGVSLPVDGGKLA